MPHPTTSKLPKPKSWDEFEDICADFCKRLWKTPYVWRYGRSGQAQKGVDIFAKPEHLREAPSTGAAAQCKNVESLTLADIETEVAKAETFKPMLREFIVLTSLDRDVNLQAEVWSKNWRITRVEIMFWEDLCLELCNHADLLRKHFPGWYRATTSKSGILATFEQSTPADYSYDDAIGQYLFNPDVGIRLVLDEAEEQGSFHEPWVKSFSSSEAAKRQVHLEHLGVRISPFWVVEADNFRHLIPLPRSQTELQISQQQYLLGQILNFHKLNYNFDDALTTAGISVDLVPPEES